jgi:8-oxo-dGTP diphosphatase
MATVVAIAVVRQENLFLVGIRPQGAPLAGYAEFPGGKVDAGESSEAAAIRECHEESGLHVESIGELLCTTHQYDHGLLEIHFFNCRPLDASATPTPPFRWIDADELASLKFPDANAPVTKLLLAN